MTKRRVVVTGMGMISPLGIGNEPTWEGIIAGRSGIGPITKFDTAQYTTKIAGEVRGFAPEKWIDKKEVKKFDTFIQYAIAASDMAVADARLDCANANGERFGVIIGSGIGGLPLIEEMHTKLLERGPSRISPFFIPGLIVNMASGVISIRHGCKGPSSRRWRWGASARCARSPRVTASRSAPRVHGTPGATASSWAKAPAS